MSVETYDSKATSRTVPDPSIPRIHSADLPKLGMSPMLTCGVCGRSGKYDVGGVAVSPSRYFERLEAEKAAAAKTDGASGEASSRSVPVGPARRSRRKARLESGPSLYRLDDPPYRGLDARTGGGMQEGIPAAEVREGILAPATTRISALETEPTALEYAIGFTRYFRCKHCDAGGPWRLPHATAIRIHLLLSFNRITGEKNGVCFAETLLYDGTWSPYPTLGECELRRRLEQSPRDAGLWLRLGNLLKNAGRADLSREPYATALQLDPLLLDAHLGLADAHGRCRAPRKAYAQWKEMLRAVTQAAHLPREERMEAASLALDRALALAHDPNDVMDLLPQPAAQPNSASRADELHLLHVTQLDLSNPRDWKKICAAFLGEPLMSAGEMRRRERAAGLDMHGSVPQAAPRAMRDPLTSASMPSGPPFAAQPTPADRAAGHVGRNAPCPCGSGRKYKKCHGAKA